MILHGILVDICEYSSINVNMDWQDQEYVFESSTVNFLTRIENVRVPSILKFHRRFSFYYLQDEAFPYTRACKKIQEAPNMKDKLVEIYFGSFKQV